MSADIPHFFYSSHVAHFVPPLSWCVCECVCVMCEAGYGVAWRGNMWYAQCALHIANPASQSTQTACVPCVLVCVVVSVRKLKFILI